MTSELKVRIAYVFITLLLKYVFIFSHMLQAFDNTLDKYSAKVQELASPGPLRRRKAPLQDGAEAVEQEIDSLNRRYKDLVANVNVKIDTMASTGKESHVSYLFEVMKRVRV